MDDDLWDDDVDWAAVPVPPALTAPVLVPRPVMVQQQQQPPPTFGLKRSLFRPMAPVARPPPPLAPQWQQPSVAPPPQQQQQQKQQQQHIYQPPPHLPAAIGYGMPRAPMQQPAIPHYAPIACPPPPASIWPPPQPFGGHMAPRPPPLRTAQSSCFAAPDPPAQRQNSHNQLRQQQKQPVPTSTAPQNAFDRMLQARTQPRALPTPAGAVAPPAPTQSAPVYRTHGESRQQSVATYFTQGGSSAAPPSSGPTRGAVIPPSDPLARFRDDAFTRIRGIPDSFPRDKLLEAATELHPFAPDTVTSWVYPTNMSVRDYQFNIVQKALFHNTLVCIPTGMGKTMIAAVVMVNYFRWFPEGKLLFMAPTRPLANQQQTACTKVTGIPEAEQVVFVGTTISPAEREGLWKSKRVFFATPQTVQHDLKSGICPASQIVCVVVDEAHRATGNFAYVVAVRELIQQGGRFRILALSATPGSKPDAVQEVVSNLCINHIEIRTETSPDLAPFTHKRNIESVTVPMSGLAEEARRRLAEFAKPILQRLHSAKAIHTDNLAQLAPFVVMKSRQEHASYRGGLSHLYGEFTSAHKLAMLCETLTLFSLRSFYMQLESLPSEMRDGVTAKGARPLLALVQSDKFREYMGWLRSHVKDRAFVSHPKMAELERIVLAHFANLARPEPAANGPSVLATTNASKVIIFANNRVIVEEIAEVLRAHRPLVRVQMFVGQSKAKSGGSGQSQKEQQLVLRKFQAAGGDNVLVSTSVGEEGLDIGDVDLILCYDVSSSPIQMLQRMGRTGRKRVGRAVCLLSPGAEVNKFNKAQQNYKSIQSVIQGRSLTLATDVPRMLPLIVRPTCVLLRFNVPPPPDAGGEDFFATGRRCRVLGPYLTDNEVIDYLHRFAPQDGDSEVATTFDLAKHSAQQILRRGYAIGASESSVAFMQLLDSFSGIREMEWVAAADAPPALSDVDPADEWDFAPVCASGAGARRSKRPLPPVAPPTDTELMLLPSTQDFALPDIDAAELLAESRAMRRKQIRDMSAAVLGPTVDRLQRPPAVPIVPAAAKVWGEDEIATQDRKGDDEERIDSVADAPELDPFPIDLTDDFFFDPGEQMGLDPDPPSPPSPKVTTSVLVLAKSPSPPVVEELTKQQPHGTPILPSYLAGVHHLSNGGPAMIGPPLNKPFKLLSELPAGFALSVPLAAAAVTATLPTPPPPLTPTYIPQSAARHPPRRNEAREIVVLSSSSPPSPLTAPTAVFLTNHAQPASPPSLRTEACDLSMDLGAITPIRPNLERQPLLSIASTESTPMICRRRRHQPTLLPPPTQAANMSPPKAPIRRLRRRHELGGGDDDARADKETRRPRKRPRHEKGDRDLGGLLDVEAEESGAENGAGNGDDSGGDSDDSAGSLVEFYDDRSVSQLTASAAASPNGNHHHGENHTPGSRLAFYRRMDGRSAPDAELDCSVLQLPEYLLRGRARVAVATTPSRSKHHRKQPQQELDTPVSSSAAATDRYDSQDSFLAATDEEGDEEGDGGENGVEMDPDASQSLEEMEAALRRDGRRRKRG
ncbi:hypothetical protein BC828DRAFT_353441 [Blastocladiella britannica]|nr:hypothetical protein BC828DRAFT_353441 [Blastocladiella britannica]